MKTIIKSLLVASSFLIFGNASAALTLTKQDCNYTQGIAQVIAEHRIIDRHDGILHLMQDLVQRMPAVSSGFKLYIYLGALEAWSTPDSDFDEVQFAKDFTANCYSGNPNFDSVGPELIKKAVIEYRDMERLGPPNRGRLVSSNEGSLARDLFNQGMKNRASSEGKAQDSNK